MWEDYSHNQNTWEMYEHEDDSLRELLNDYYGKNLMTDKDERYTKVKKKKKSFVTFYFYFVRSYYFELLLWYIGWYLSHFYLI